jgi:hypothetical protein
VVAGIAERGRITTGLGMSALRFDQIREHTIHVAVGFDAVRDLRLPACRGIHYRKLGVVFLGEI